MSDEASPDPPKGGWPTSLAATGSPLKVFALTALWSPRSLHHPKELLELRHSYQDDRDDQEIFPQERPWVPTLVIAGFVLVYAVYQLARD